MQITQYINLLNIDSPSLFTSVFSKADMMSNLNLNFTFIKNPFNTFSTCSIISKNIKNIQMAPSFIYNTGNQIFVWVLLLALYGICVVMLKIVSIKCVKIRNFFGELKESYFYSLPIEMYNELFITIVFYAFINLLQAEYSCYTYYIDMLLAVIFICLSGFYYHWVNTRTPLHAVSELHLKQYSPLFRDIHLEIGGMRRKLFVITLGLKVAYALSIALLLQYPLAQSITTSVIIASYTLYLMLAKPFSSLKLNYINIFNYSCLTLLIILKAICYFIMNEMNENILGIMMSVIFALPIAQSLIIFGIDYYFSLVKSMYLKIRTCITKRKIHMQKGKH